MLKTQMTSQEVVVLLGDPTSQAGQRASSIRAGESSGTDHYEDETDTFGVLSGRVFFDDTDRVTEWVKPSFIPLSAAGSGDFLVEGKWNKLQTQMTSEHVKALLGEPIISTASGDYIYQGRTDAFGVVEGRVFFRGTDRVTDWTRPSFGSRNFRFEANWNKLQEKMTRQQVEALLGEPIISTASGDYIYQGRTDAFGVVEGRVFFDDTDRVTEVRKPNFISVPD